MTKAALLALLLGIPIVWIGVTEWLRHRSWVKTRDSGFSPGTQHLVMLQSLVIFLCLIAAGAVACFMD